MGLTDKMELYPRLAECIEQIEPTAWNVVLKAGIKFHVFAIGVALFWYAQAQVRWFMHDLGIGAAKALSIFAGAFLFATVAAFVVALLITLDFKSVAPAAS
ncbi:hypothetical protein EN41_11260 [Agrobacterium tumefaciens]|jgi:hypothetical protein|uniref:hypothetical protein n=1 Tax=Agrobacterium fabrum TaxID=1176649 RepID=UPI0002EC94BB|nr:hypothetical protein [Agrobacterium fabrum]KEY50017.1 hypothetical protein EN41_11260 [Agrobacterium tumefaciens]KJX85424.1 hypothetical protein SY94_4829 [Agrobacterium tumefaciens]MCX2878510.1 hypothetical protein [Agrobacterium fabrum]NMV73030.1 hypothetical protein [Agrobacterium fabrum]QQN08888.1 hypothetical protein EML4058_22930 [Agrobacterium fabrum]